MKVEYKILYGLGANQKEFKIEAELLKSEALKRSVRTSSDFQLCEKEEGIDRKLSPICEMVRNQAASLDEADLTLTVPKSISESTIVKLLEDLVKAIHYFTQIKEPSAPSSIESTNFHIKALVSPSGEKIQMLVEYPGASFEIKNIRVPFPIRAVLPISIRNSMSHWLLQKATGTKSPASCKAEPHFIRTFDNKTYEYMINDCEHVLLTDRSTTLPIAVLTRTLNQRKVVKVLAGVSEITVTPIPSGSFQVKINGKSVHLAKGETVREKSHATGQTIVELKRYRDDVYYIYVPSQGIQVLTDGQHVEVVVPEYLRTRAAGLCGDLNGESTADLKTPETCITKAPRYTAFSYMLNKEGSSRASAGPVCSGIPAGERAIYRQEVSRCTKKEAIPTPLTKLSVEAVRQEKVLRHVVKLTPGQVCISRQKVTVCNPEGGVLEREGSKPIRVEFGCVSRTSSKGQTLQRKAFSGELELEELEQLPTKYWSIEYEPVTCRPRQSSSPSSNPVMMVGESSIIRGSQWLGRNLDAEGGLSQRCEYNSDCPDGYYCNSSHRAGGRHAMNCVRY